MVAAGLGWVGTIGTMVAYILQSRGRLAPASRTYATMNVVGGILGGTSSMVYGAWPSVASNVVWAGVGAWSLVSTSLESARARRSAFAAVSPEPALAC